MSAVAPSTQTIPSASRAILITEIVEMGGAERSALALSRWLFEQGIPNHVVTYRDQVGLQRFAQHPVTVLELRPEMVARHKIAALRRYFQARPDAPKPLTSGFQPALHATLAGMRGFHTLMHDTPSLFTDPDQPVSLPRSLARRLSDRIVAHGLGSGGQTIVTSDYLRAETRRVFGVEASLARMGGLTSADAFQTRPVSDGLRMFSVSRIEPNKRIDWMIRSFATLENSGSPLSASLPWSLDVAGKGSQLEELRTLIRQVGLEDRIRLLGFVSDAELERLYNAAQLFLMPAVQGYGIPAIEALQRGIPVLLHRDSGVSDILLDTPWATVLTGGEGAMVPALTEAIDRARRGVHLDAPLPPIPTEDAWAERVARLCSWI